MLLCQIEACLNSHSIVPIFDNLDDSRWITFWLPIIFGSKPFLSLPPNQVLDLNEHRLSRWQMVQQIIEGFGSPVITCILFNNAQNGALFNWSKSAKSFLCVTSGSIEPMGTWSDHDVSSRWRINCRKYKSRSEYRQPIVKLYFPCHD